MGIEQLDTEAAGVADAAEVIEQGGEGNVAVAGKDAVGVAGELAGRIGQVAELDVKEIVGSEAGHVLGLAGADVEVEGVEAQTKVRTGNIGNERGHSLEVVAEGGSGLEFKGGANIALGGFLGDLGE